MKPIRLTMQAFGSYGAKTVVDFTKPSQNIFLITGDTGSGKSTIFDTIVFALYGEASSNRNKKDGAELQSQYVELSVEPFVELEFLERDGLCDLVYTVKRVPRHLRPAKRGKEPQKESESVSLTMPDGTVYPQKETDKKLEEIVGLTKSQFMQVAMIAQGEFMDLLRAKSEERKPIFRKLFGTELFQKIVDELALRRKEQQVEMARIRTECKAEAAHITVPEDYEEQQEMRQLCSNVINGERLNIADLENLMAQLEKLNTVVDVQLAAAEERCIRADGDFLEKWNLVNEGNRITELYRKLDEAEKNFAESAQPEERIQELRSLAVQIGNAFELQRAWQRMQEAGAAKAGTEELLKKCVSQLPELENAVAAAVTEAAEAREHAEQELTVFSAVSEKVKKYRGQLAEIEIAQKDADDKKIRNDSAEKKVHTAEKNLLDFETQEAECRKEAERLQDADTKLLRWETEKKKAEGVREKLDSATTLQTEISDLQNNVEACREKYRIARDSYEEKNTAYEYIRTQFLNAQAGLIAREQLHVGEPCPVCGSKEHPAPCRLREEHRELTREKLEKERTVVEKLRQSQDDAAQEAANVTADLAAKERVLEQSLAALQREMADYCPGLPDTVNIAAMETVYRNWSRKLTDEGKQCRKDADQLKRLRDFLNGAETQRNDLRSAAKETAEEWHQTVNELTAAQANLDALRKNLEYPTPQAANQTLDAAEKRQKACHDLAVQKETAEKQARTACDNTRTHIQLYKNQLPELTAKEKQAQADYAELLTKKEMPELRWQELTQAYTREASEKFRKQAEGMALQRIQLESDRRNAREAIGDREKPDMEALQKLLQQAEEAKNSAMTAKNNCAALQRENRNAYDKLAPKIAERKEVVKLSGRLDNLYNLLAGKVTGAKMDIETYVQRYYLKRILHAANRRFLDMTAGQFELRMYDLDKAGDGRNHGLDLLVYSTVTGKLREIGTLSGGESFMAALAMALGMADQIQSHSASVNLDMMFIDEGFGSLSENARNQAVRVLKQMAGDAKLIGLISHVSELKQELGDQMIVTRDDFGSHVRWQNN